MDFVGLLSVGAAGVIALHRYFDAPGTAFSSSEAVAFSGLLILGFLLVLLSVSFRGGSREATAADVSASRETSPRP